jgi:hypothetical protein
MKNLILLFDTKFDYFKYIRYFYFYQQLKEYKKTTSDTGGFYPARFASFKIKTYYVSHPHFTDKIK